MINIQELTTEQKDLFWNAVIAAGGGPTNYRLTATTISPNGDIDPESPQWGNRATLTVVQVAGDPAVPLELVRYADDNKPAAMQISKSRGDGPYAHRGALAGDRIARIHFNASRAGTASMGAPGEGYFVHAGEITVLAEQDARDNMNGVASRMTFAVYSYPDESSYTQLEFLVASSTGRVQIPAGNSVLITEEIPGWLTLPANTAEANGASIKFTLTDAALMPTPEPGALEVPADGLIRTTDAAGKRRQVVAVEELVLEAAALTEGTGTISIVQMPGWVRVTRTTGPEPLLGTLIRLNFPTTLSAAPFAVFGASNQATVDLATKVYLSTNTVRMLIATVVGQEVPANTTYEFTIHYQTAPS